MPEPHTITVRVTPRASKNELRFDCGSLTARVTAPPVDNSANEACCELIADYLHVARSRVHVIRGGKSRVKTILVDSYEGEWPWPEMKR